MSASVAVVAQGLAFGMLLQLSVGPVCLGVFQKGLSGRLAPALWMVLGVAVADGLYIALALVGVSELLEISGLRIALGLLGAVTLVWFGLRTLRSAASVAMTANGGEGALGSLRYGFVLTLTNPLTALFWTGVFAGLAAGSFGADRAAATAFGLGCIGATLLFLTVVATSGRALGRLLASRAALLWLNRAVGVLLIAFALKLAIDTVA